MMISIDGIFPLEIVPFGINLILIDRMVLFNSKFKTIFLKGGFIYSLTFTVWKMN